jgi:glycosyltransferase involved in cell wall biosynthesis
MVRPLRVAQIAPVWTKVPPDAYGGAELMVYWLTEELVRLGHQVTLFATGDSTTSAKLQSCCEENIIGLMAKLQAYRYEGYAAGNMAECLKQSRDFDIIHCHMGSATIPYTSLSKTPVVHTIHEGLDSQDEHWLLARYPQIPIAAISHAQVSTVPSKLRRNIPIIYHGCDLTKYIPSTSTLGYLAFIGRMSEKKNPAGAIRTAKELQMPIRLAGAPQTETERQYFNEIIKPQIDDDQVIYLGSISQSQKIEFLSHALAVIFPIQWEEHFGLVMIEAMACGTPVVALERGSVTEVIDKGITGYYSTQSERLPDLVRKALLLDRHKVRQQVEGRFSVQRMVNEYVDLYQKIIESAGAR